MSEHLKGKKLLILGGVRAMLEVANRAKELGVLVYVTDYLEDSPCKAVADKAFMVNATDVDAVVELCKAEQIDGIITGYVDMLLPYYAQICEKAGLPCYATKEQFDMLTDKTVMKEMCKLYNVPTTPEYTEEQIEQDDIDYPVIVKPADSSGARGITLCNNHSELLIAIKEALELSPKKKVIVEKYMTTGTVLMHYFIQDGEPILIGMGDSYGHPVGKENRRTTSLMVLPSMHTKQYLEDVDTNVKKLICGLGLKNGLFEPEAYLYNGKPHIGDVGYRLTGSHLQYIFKEILGLYSVDLMINFALTGRMADYRIDSRANPYLCGKYAARVTISLFPGKVTQIVGEEQLKKMPEVIGVHLIASVGDVFTKADIGRLRRVASQIFIIADYEQDIPKIANKVYDAIDFIDENGKSMKTNSNHYAEYLCKK